jgi:hypothetical protein
MLVRDLFSNWEGPGVLAVHDGTFVLTLDGNVIPPDQTWFLRLVEATEAERKAMDEAG